MKKERDPWEPLPQPESAEESFRRAMILLLAIVAMTGIALVAAVFFNWKF